MGPDELLFWLSARHEGSWVQFRSAVEEIMGERNGAGDDRGIPFYQRIRFSLEQLGHVEFAGRSSQEGWRVAPPILAVSEQPEGFLGITCGARSPRLMSRLEGHEGFEISANGTYPTTARILSPDLESLSRVAPELGLGFQPHAPLRLLSCLSRVDVLPGAKHSNLPFGRDFEVSRFVVGRHSCNWVGSSDDEAEHGTDGLYRFVRFQVPEYFLKWEKRIWKVDGQTGKFFVLAKRRRRVLRYDSSNRVLSVPWICRPPLLVDRALVLCTGNLPVDETTNRRLEYAGINEGIAGFAASLLCQN